jgi:hypothetical protein
MKAWWVNRFTGPIHGVEEPTRGDDSDTSIEESLTPEGEQTGSQEPAPPDDMVRPPDQDVPPGGPMPPAVLNPPAATNGTHGAVGTPAGRRTQLARPLG